MPSALEDFTDRVGRIISAHLPRDLPSDIELAEFDLDGQAILELIAARSADPRLVGPPDYPPQLDDEVARWRTFHDVQVSCLKHGLIGIVLARHGCLITIKADHVERHTCRFPLDFDLTRVGLNQERGGRIHRELTYGDARGHVAVCQLFPLAEFLMCVNTRQMLALAQAHNRWPDQIPVTIESDPQVA